MFTGIVEEIGRVRSATRRDNGVELWIDARHVLGDLRPGASVAIDGVCQTVLEQDAHGFCVAAEHETLRVTTLGGRIAGTEVNLERALGVGGRLDGHWVLGHVDGQARVLGVRQEGRSHVLALELSAALARFVVPKGCITLDGVSLTVGPAVHAGRFEVFLIPYTRQQTTLQLRRPGDAVNVETDVLARTIFHLLGRPPGAPEGSATRSEGDNE